MEPLSRDEQLALERYKLLFGLWMSENPIKTNKLQMLMATNSILASAFFLTEQTLWIALVGMAFSAVWVFSIGRTVAYQEHWRGQMEELRLEHSDNPMFQVHSTRARPSLLGSLRSKYYLLGTPLATSTAWLVVLLYTLLT